MQDLWNIVTGHEAIDKIIPLFDAPAYMVGGCLRDIFLRSEPDDYDIVTFGDVWSLAQAIAEALDATPFWLDSERGIVRIASRALPFHLDISAPKGSTIEEDLSLRDLTINAMALDLRSGELIDPCRGRDDCLGGNVRVISEENLVDDPLRVLRCLRFALLPGFDFDMATAGLVRKHASKIAGVAAERIKQEIMASLNYTGGTELFVLMNAFGLLEHLFPQYRDMDQGQHHKWSLVTHALLAADEIDRLIPAAERYLPGVGDYFNREIEGAVTRAGLLKFVCFLHDIGKPEARVEDDCGEPHFWGHASNGAQLTRQICREFKFSNAAVRVAGGIVEHHMRPLEMVLHGGSNPRAIYRLLNDIDEIVPEVLLHAIADAEATGKERESVGSRKYMELTAAKVWDFYNQLYLPMQAAPLLNGSDIMQELGLGPGAEIGRLLSEVAEERAAGNIRTRAEALAFLRLSRP